MRMNEISRAASMGPVMHRSEIIRDLSFFTQAPVVENDDDVMFDIGRGLLIHHKHTVEASRNLLGRLIVGVIPIGARVPQQKFIEELSICRNGVL